jgi:hypothetical protein
MRHRDRGDRQNAPSQYSQVCGGETTPHQLR